MFDSRSLPRRGLRSDGDGLSSETSPKVNTKDQNILRGSLAGSNRQSESLPNQQSFSLNDPDQVKEIEDGTIAGVSTALTSKSSAQISLKSE